MADKLDQKETVSFKELLINNTYTQEAIINLLDKKGIINKQDIFNEMIRLYHEQAEANLRGKDENNKIV